MDELQHHGPRDLHPRLGLRYLRGHDHAACHPHPHQGMGHHAGDDWHRDDGFALAWIDRDFRVPGAGRFLWPQAVPHLDHPRLCGLHRSHRPLGRPGQPFGFQLDHPHCARRRKPGRHDHGDRDGADEMACHRLGRPRRRLSVRLHAVLALGARRRAAVGLALALLPRHRAGAARSLGADWNQGKPALRARHRADAEGRVEEETRHRSALPRLPARDDGRDAYLFLLPVDLDRLVGVDAVLPLDREAFGFPGHGQLPLGLDVRRDLRLLAVRLAVRSSSGGAGSFRPSPYRPQSCWS